jgi:hypothetical protein
MPISDAPKTVDPTASPTPVVRGNLPSSPDQGEATGREVPARPMEWYERQSPRTLAGAQIGPWPVPTPTPGPGGLQASDINRLHQQNPAYYSKYSQGGMVKHGSATRVSCRRK